MYVYLQSLCNAGITMFASFGILDFNKNVNYNCSICGHIFATRIHALENVLQDRTMKVINIVLDLKTRTSALIVRPIDYFRL